MAFFIILALLLIFFLKNNTPKKEIEDYVRRRGGELVSQKREFLDPFSLLNAFKPSIDKHNQSYKVIYYDKRKVLRAVLVRESNHGEFTFTGDHQVPESEKPYLVGKRKKF